MKSDKPKISVLMPVYNGDKFLRKSIKSILNQTFNNFEYIIINDGSTDDSLKIIESYEDSRIKIIIVSFIDSIINTLCRKTCPKTIGDIFVK